MSNIATRLSALVSGAFSQQASNANNDNVPHDSRHNTDQTNSTRIHAEDGIAAAIVEAGGTGLGLGITFGIRAPPPLEQFPNNMLQRLSRVSLTSTDHTHAGDIVNNHTVYASPDHHPVNRDLERILPDRHSFTSSPRSGAAPLPASPARSRPNAFATPHQSNSYYDRFGNVRKRRPGEQAFANGRTIPERH